MLSGSALVRVAVLVLVAALLAALVQIFWPSSGQEISQVRDAPATSSSQAPPVTKSPPPEVRSAPAAPDPRTAERPPEPNPARPAPPPPEPPPTPEPVPQRAAPTVFDQTPRAEPVQDAAGAAADATGPRALAVVDLNSASLAELNGLQGGGAIGKAIVRGRPYATVDQLLSKRILSRSTYQRIKDQVTVR
ncbi:helix-hairpin-helix domain-containing protein [Methylobacterium sp. Leaf108]|uniref:ComEA family DNA-binding protein n=1 Tax=Methylobacterium sp. Leaf108 TaxID=1736256 RepID=UPI0009E91A3F|nr:helix-hairpin-helix domain-containing protein [Methylobacterium sp. Leaf108]